MRLGTCSVCTHAHVQLRVSLQSVARYRMLPAFLSWNPAPFATPVPAILLQGLICGIMMNFSFGTLVVLGKPPCAVVSIIA